MAGSGEPLSPTPAPSNPPPRIVEVEQDNKMTPGNLGIVFGPTLLRPRPTEATVSLSSLVDYPHQARIVETLITHYGAVFEEKPEEEATGQVRWQVSPGLGAVAFCPWQGTGGKGWAVSKGSFKQRTAKVWVQIWRRPCWVQRL